MIVKSKAPMRMGIAGGGTDIPDYINRFEGAVVNAAISVFSYCEIRDLDEDIIIFEASEQSKVFQYDITEPIGSELMIHSSVYDYMINTYNKGKKITLKISTFCEVPQGSGLGGSSALCVSIIKAFLEYLDIPMDDYSLCNLAHFIERKVCGLAGGKQDQIASVFGGFNFIEFKKDDITIVTKLRLRNWVINEIESSALLFYSGSQRDSSKIINAQNNEVKNDNKTILENLHQMKKEAYNVREHLLNGNFESIYQSIKNGWTNKIGTNFEMNNVKTNKVFSIISKSEVKAVKLSGAGGGGHIFVFVPLEARLKLIEDLSKANLGWFTPFTFSADGCQSWKIN